MEKGYKRPPFSEEWRRKISETLKQRHIEGKAGGFKKGHEFVGVSIGDIMKGKDPWNKGKELPYIPHNKMKGHIPWNKGLKVKTPNHFTLFTKGHSITPKGDKHWNWKGGTRSLRKYIQECDKYVDWRTNVFKRDDFTCTECHQKGVKIQAHHIKSFSSIVKGNDIKTLDDAINCDSLWSLENGKTLCISCHKKTDNYGKKSIIRKVNITAN